LKEEIALLVNRLLRMGAQCALAVSLVALLIESRGLMPQAAAQEADELAKAQSRQADKEKAAKEEMEKAKRIKITPRPLENVPAATAAKTPGDAAKEAKRAQASANNAEKSAERSKEEADRSAAYANASAANAELSEAAAATSATSAKKALASEAKAAHAAAKSRKFSDEAVGRVDRKIRSFLDDAYDSGRIGKDNGIGFGPPKVFDNRTLLLMLESLSESLRAVQVVDAKSLAASLGLFQGMQTQSTSRGLAIKAGGIPGVVRAEEGEVTDTLGSKNAFTTVTKPAGIETTAYDEASGTLVNRNKVSETLTSAARNPEIAGLPDLLAAPSYQPAYGLNATDLLSDQVNLSYQTYNIRMLIERSLTDRIWESDKPRMNVVLGMNVSLDPPKNAEGSAAVIELTVRFKDPGGKKCASSGCVSLVSLMPKEQTYNSVALRSSANQFGGSAVAKVVTVGYNERRQSQVFYLYRDNDTLSFQRTNADDQSLRFGWQFRPVLGRRSVAPGMRQMFAVIAVPAEDLQSYKSTENLEVTVKTSWRKYYPDTLTTAKREQIGIWPHVARVASLGLKEGVPPSQEVCKKYDVELPSTANYQSALQPRVEKVWWTRVDGNNALVTVEGDNFFPGTSVIIGSNNHTSPATGLFIKSAQAMDLLTPLDNLGQTNAVIMGRYGPAVQLRQSRVDWLELQASVARLWPVIGDYRKIQINLTCTEAGVKLSQVDLPQVCDGGKCQAISPALSLRGAILKNDISVADLGDGTLQFETEIATTALKNANGGLMLRFPFQASYWNIPVSFTDPDRMFSTTRIDSGDRTTFIIVSNEYPAFKGGKWGVRMRDDYCPDAPQLATIREGRALTFTLSAEELKAQGSKKLQLYKGDDKAQHYVLDLPEADPKPPSAVSYVGGSAPKVLVNDQPLIFVDGSKATEVYRIVLAGVEILPEYDSEKKQLRFLLPSAASAKAANIVIQFRDIKGSFLGSLNLPVEERPKQAKPKAL
jgi:hypothetical protein